MNFRSPYTPQLAHSRCVRLFQRAVTARRIGGGNGFEAKAVRGKTSPLLSPLDQRDRFDIGLEVNPREADAGLDGRGGDADVDEKFRGAALGLDDLLVSHVDRLSR